MVAQKHVFVVFVCFVVVVVVYLFVAPNSSFSPDLFRGELQK